MHKNPHIDINGVTYKLGFSNLSHSKKNQENAEEFEEEDNLNYGDNVLNSRGDLFGNLGNDISVDNTSAWKGVLCSPFDRSIFRIEMWIYKYIIKLVMKKIFKYEGIYL